MKHIYDHFSNNQSSRKVGVQLNERGGQIRMHVSFKLFKVLLLRNLKKMNMKIEKRRKVLNVVKVINETWLGIVIGSASLLRKHILMTIHRLCKSLTALVVNPLFVQSHCCALLLKYEHM